MPHLWKKPLRRLPAAMLASSILVSSILVSSILLCTPVTAATDPYWGMQAAYNQAMEKKNPDAICKAVEDIITLYKDLSTPDACYRVITPLLQAVKIYEENGRYSDALRLYKIYKKAWQAIDRLTDKDCAEALTLADAMLSHYENIIPTVYALANDPADVPYYNAKGEPETGTYLGMCNGFDPASSNGYLLYAQFGTENISDFHYLIPKTDGPLMLEVGWNLSDEDSNLEALKAIAEGKQDEYLEKNLTWLGTLTDCHVLLRFAAEVNCWGVNTTYKQNGKLEEFKKVYKDAFRHVHDLAETYAPNVAMVYSPNDVSNMYVTHQDFYPGDEYVDWVGISSYSNQAANTEGTYGSRADALYGRGKYDNQFAKISGIIKAYGNRKPLLVSECGFCYQSEESAQSAAYAGEKLAQFYTYINMLYPQIKAVYYFNTNFEGDNYQLFGEEGGNTALAETYNKATSGNLAAQSLLKGKAAGYTRLSTLNEVRDDLILSVYASYPGNPDKKVTYTLDNQKIAEVTAIPYTAQIGKDKLTVGKHTLVVTTDVGRTVYTQTYQVQVDAAGLIRVSETGPAVAKTK